MKRPVRTSRRRGAPPTRYLRRPRCSTPYPASSSSRRIGRIGRGDVRGACSCRLRSTRPKTYGSHGEVLLRIADRIALGDVMVVFPAGGLEGALDLPSSSGSPVPVSSHASASVQLSHRWSTSATIVVPSENTTSRHARPSIDSGSRHHLRWQAPGIEDLGADFELAHRRPAARGRDRRVECEGLPLDPAPRRRQAARPTPRSAPARTPSGGSRSRRPARPRAARSGRTAGRPGRRP